MSDDYGICSECGEELPGDPGNDVCPTCTEFAPCGEAGCQTFLYPCGSDGDERRPYVERCDACDVFANDEEAATHVAALVGGLVVLALRHDRAGAWQPAVYPWPKEAE